MGVKTACEKIIDHINQPRTEYKMVDTNEQTNDWISLDEIERIKELADGSLRAYSFDSYILIDHNEYNLLKDYL